MALNWTYMYGMANDPPAEPGRRAASRCSRPPPGPSGRPGVNGSMAPRRQRAGSKNQDAGLEVHRATSPASRFRTSTPSARCPVWKSSYDNPAVVKTNPAVVPQAKKQLGDLILRPQVESYNAISQALQAEIQNALLGDKTPQQALDDAAVQGRVRCWAHERLPRPRTPRGHAPAPRWSAACRGRAGSPCSCCCPRPWWSSAWCSTRSARTFVISLYDVTSPMPGDYPFVGLSNYTRVFSRHRRSTRVLGHTMYFTLVSTLARAVLGIAVALLLNAPLRARWLWRSIVVLPWALPTIVNGAMWRWIYNGQYGALNGLLTRSASPRHRPSGSGSPFLALNMVIVADVWKNTSIVAFFILAGLQTIPRDLYEAARMDGAGTCAAFWRITLPLLAPSIAIVLILRTIEAFKVFDIIYVMTGGGPASGTQTIAFYTYLQAFSNQLFGYGAALAYLIVLAVFALAMVYLRLLRQGQMAGVE